MGNITLKNAQDQEFTLSHADNAGPINLASNEIANKDFVNNKPSGYKNLLINGAMDVWQRGSSFTPTTSAVYTVDRWKGYYAAGSHGSVSLISQSTDVPATENFKYSLKIDLDGTGTAGWPIARQIIEDFNTVIGTTSKKDLTLSYWAKASEPSDLAVDLGDTNTTGSTVSLTTEWQKFSVTWPAGTSFTFSAVDFQNYHLKVHSIYITGVQLEYGSVATPFEYRHYGLELSLCQRYYQRTRAYAGRTTSGGERSGFTAFNTTMRTNPSLTFVQYGEVAGPPGNRNQAYGVEWWQSVSGGEYVGWDIYADAEL